jgi:hypothetical protein
MGKGRNARLKLSEADRQAADLLGGLADIQADSEGRRARFLEIVAGLEATPPDELRGLVARWQIEAEFLRARIALAETHAHALAPLADLGWQTFEADLKQADTKAKTTAELYGDAAVRIARSYIAESTDQVVQWKHIIGAIRAHPEAPRHLPGCNRAISNYLQAQGVALPARQR